jgi:hypothetical protein
MGLLTGLLTFPLAPLRGTVAVAEQVLKQAEEVYYDPATIRRELEEVERLREAGEIDDEEATAWEDQLIERLMEGRSRATRSAHE